MKVELISSTYNLLDILYWSARTCYSSEGPISMYEDPLDVERETKLRLIEKCIKSRHLSVLEHSQFTFAIEGISRACSHQLVRHRHCSFSQQSQRYVEIKEDFEKIQEIKKPSEMIKIAEKYFIFRRIETGLHCFESLRVYLEFINYDNMKPEDARAILPNCTKTNLVLTCNLRELMHLCNERLCSKAQKEIRQLVQLMANEVTKNNEWLKPYLAPKCEMLGHCPEDKSCGRKAK